MEELRRKIKILWTEHGIPILFWAIILVIVFAIIQLLNYNAMQNLEKGDRVEQKNTTAEPAIYRENEAYTKLINNFLEYCKNGNIQQAYEMLSENCKKDLYPTIDNFTSEYYNKLFKQQNDIKVEYNVEKDIYVIKFYEDILESGKLANRDYISDEYKIEREILEEKIYINYNNSIK